MITVIDTKEDLETVLNKKGDTWICICFTNIQCGLCRKFEMVFEKKSEEYPDIEFYVLFRKGFEMEIKDQDVWYMPTVQIRRDGEVWTQFLTAKTERFEQYLKGCLDGTISKGTIEQYPQLEKWKQRTLAEGKDLLKEAELKGKLAREKALQLKQEQNLESPKNSLDQRSNLISNRNVGLPTKRFKPKKTRGRMAPVIKSKKKVASPMKVIRPTRNSNAKEVISLVSNSDDQNSHSQINNKVEKEKYVDIPYIKSVEEFHNITNRKNDRLTIINFTKDECTACKKFNGIYQRKAGVYHDCDFYYMKGNSFLKLLKEHDIKFMPSVQFWKNGVVKDYFVSFKEKKFVKRLESHR